MDQNRWNRVKELLIAAEALPEAERTAWVADACGDDVSLQNEVLELLEDDTVGTSKLALPPAQPRVGDLAGMRLGPWRLVRLLGSGGMGSVWLAERADDAFQMMAAAKLAKKTFTSPEALARFKRERQLLADLKHPNIATLYDGGTTPDGNPYFIMEYITGKTIDAWCFERNLSRTDILGLFRQLCLAVAYAHRKEVLHRDIKPANVMVDGDGHVKLMDFGIASSHQEGLTKLTRSSMSPMTPAYASPEQLYGGTVTEKADIYAMGLVLFQLLSHKRISSMEGRPLQALASWLEDRGDVAEEIADLLNHMLAREVSQRMASVDAVIKELDQILGHSNDGAQPLKYDAMIWYGSEWVEAAESLARRLEDEQGLQVWLESGHQEASTPVEKARAEALAFCGALVVMVAPEQKPWEDDKARRPMVSVLSRLRRRVVPLLLGGASRPPRESALPPFMRRLNWQDLQEPAQDSLENLARAIRGLAPSRPVEETATETCPFRGLDVFREEDARFFFGREALIQRLENHMKYHRFLAVLGPSGSGKSSVVQAGLIPALRARGDAIVMLTPTATPLMELAYQITQLLEPKDNPATLLNHMEEREEGLYLALRNWSEQNHGFCLVIDQLEELFTLANEAEEVARFLGNLFLALERSDIQFAIVVTLRSDFLGRCVVWPELDDYITDNMVQVKPMGEQELLRAMKEPAALAGFSWEKGLPEKILADLMGSSSELPLLEHVLLELYERRRGRTLLASAYTEIGGVEGALAHRAESIFGELDEQGQQMVRKMFTLCLVHPGEGAEDTRRRAARTELLTVGGNPAKSEMILDQFIEARLLTARINEARDQEQIDVSHEALIRKWGRIKSWMAEDRETARLLGRLRRRARVWDQANRDRDFLIAGGQLYQMTELRKREVNHLGDLAHTFIEACVAQEKKQRRFRNTVSALAVILLIWVTLDQIGERKKSEAAAKEARRLTQIAEEAKKDANNYSKAIVFDRMAGIALDREHPVEAWLYSLNALSQEVHQNRILPEPMGRLFDSRMADVNRLLWTSPFMPKASTLAISRDDQMLALVGQDNLIRLIDLSSGRQKGTLTGVYFNITDPSFSPDGKWLAAASERKEVYLWRIEDYSLQVIHDDFPGRVTAVAYSPKSTFLVSAGENGSLRLFSLEQMEELPSFQLGMNIKDLTFGEHDKEIYAAGNRGILRLELHPQKGIISQHPLTVSVKGAATALAWHAHTGLVSGWDGGQLVFHAAQTVANSRHEGPVQSLSINRLGQKIASADENKLLFWQPDFASSQKVIVASRELTDLSSPVFVDGRVIALHKEDGLVDYTYATNQHEPLALGHSGEVWSVEFSPDGRWLASGSGDKTIGLWDLQGEMNPRFFEGHGANVTGLAFSPDGLHLASASWDRTVRLWDLATGSASILQGHSAEVTSVAFSPDGSRLASASWDETIRLWDVATGEASVLQGHSAGVLEVAFSPDGSTLASASFDRTVRLWDIATGEASVLQGHRSAVWGVTFSPDGSRMASASQDQTVRLWNPVTGKATELKGHTGTVIGVAFSPDGTRLVSVSADKTARVWNVGTGEALVLKGHSAPIWGVAFSPDGTHIASGSHDRTVKVWDAAAGEASVLHGHSEEVYSVTFSPDGSRLASGSLDNTVRVWDIITGGAFDLTGHKEGVIGLAFSPDGSYLASGSHDRSVRLWNLASRETSVLDGHSKSVVGLAFSPDGSRLASASWDNTVRIWSPDTGESSILEGHSESVNSVAFSPDGSYLASGSRDQTVRLWNATTGTASILRGHLAPVYGVTFSPDGSLLASASLDQTVRLWDVATGETSVLQGHLGYVYGVAFSPDGKLLVSTSADRSVRIWDAVARKTLAVLLGHSEEVNWFPAFSPDGTLLVTPSDDKTVRLWRMSHLITPPPTIPAQHYFEELLKRSRYFFGYRQKDTRLDKQIHTRIKGTSDHPHPYDHLDHPRPQNIPLHEWLMQGYITKP